MTMTKDALQFGIEPVRITDTDNIQVNEGLPTNADPQVYALQLAKTVKAMLNGVLKDAQDNIPFPVEILPTRNSLPTQSSLTRWLTALCWSLSEEVRDLKS